MVRKYLAEDAAEELAFEGSEMLPAINVAETVDSLLDSYSHAEAIQHAASVARAARAMKEEEVAADWEAVTRAIRERQAAGR